MGVLRRFIKWKNEIQGLPLTDAAHIPNITEKAKISVSLITPRKESFSQWTVSLQVYPPQANQRTHCARCTRHHERGKRGRKARVWVTAALWWTADRMLYDKDFHMYLVALRNRPILRHPSPELGTICVLGSDLNRSQRIQKAWLK